MHKARENHWRIPQPARRPAARRDQLLREIALALVTETGVCTDPRQHAGIDPYNSSLGSSSRDIWQLPQLAGQ